MIGVICFGVLVATLLGLLWLLLKGKDNNGYT